MAESDLMSVSQVAALERCSVGNILQHIRRGSLPATKVGRDWIIRRADYEQWRAKRIEDLRRRLEEMGGE